MYYEPGRIPHNLPHDPFKSCVVPRPIGWISTVDIEGNHNLAPYSQFQNVTFNPPIVMFAANQDSKGVRKDSVRNAEQTGEFVWNMATWDLREAMNQTSATLARGASEFAHAGLELAPSRLVAPPRVAAAHVALECRVTQVVQLEDVDGADAENIVVFGQVVGVHVDEAYIVDGRVDLTRLKPVARCGYKGDYAVVESLFEMFRPDSAS